MVRKKNKMFVDSADRTPHYSLRKLSVGVASVLLSTTLWMGANGSVAHADTVQAEPTTRSQQNTLPPEQANGQATGKESDNTTKQETSDDLDGKKGNLSSLIDQAKQDGLTVTKEEGAKTYATKQEALDDLNNQTSDIQSKVTKYEAEKAAYDAAKKVYDEDLAKWNDAQSSSAPHMVKGISQRLSFTNERDASLEVTSESGKSPVNFIKSSAWQGDGNGVYTDGITSGGNISKSFSESDISHDQGEGTGKDSKDWGKTYTGIQLKVGESVVAGYTGLKNSVYIDKENVAHKLSKVQVMYTLNETTANDNTANIFLSNNPNIGLWYGAAGDRGNGRVDLTVDLTFYDENGKPIILGKDSNAWLDMSSLNNGTTKVEYFAPNGNTTEHIPGSSITSHADGWYADNNNEMYHHADWDNPTSDDRYYGAAIMELEGNSFHLEGNSFHIGQKITKYMGQNLTNSRNVYSWFALDSSLATAYEPVKPTEPNKPNIAWHEVTHEPQKATVTYIDDTAQTTLKSDSLEGDSNSVASKDGKTYTTGSSIEDYEKKGYEFVSDSTNGDNVVFDNDSSVDQNYEVHLKHGTESNKDETTVKETIHYKYADGSKAAEDHSDSVTLSRTGTKDKVTGTTDWNAWSTGKISSVTSPTIPGYTADKKEIDEKFVNGPHDEFVETVTYAKKQKATVTYIDDTAQTTLKSDSLEGDSNSVASKDGKTYTTGSSIEDYEKKGYEFVSDSTNGDNVVFDNDSSVDQNYEVHLKHGTVTVTPDDKNPVNPGDKINPNDPNSHTYKDDVKHDNLAKDAKQTVYYEGAGTDTPADSVTTQKDAFTRTVTYDKVTGESTTSVWSKAETTFGTVDTPVVNGYTANKKQAGGLTATPDHPEVEDTVVYTPNGSIVPVDPNGNPIPNTPSVPYETDPTDPTKVVDGKVPEVPNWTPKNGDPVKPSDPTKDTYVPYDHTKTTIDPKVEGKQTVTYVYKDKNGKVVKTKTVEQDTTFTGKTTKDEVTGETTITWEQKNHTYKPVNTPVEPGYTADKKIVGGETVTPDNPNRSYTVVYTPNGSIVPVDPNGNPIPNTPSVPYETDPTDPTKVVDGKVPEVPGWTPRNGKPGDTVKPSDPTKDTGVTYDHTKTTSDPKVEGKQTVTYVYKDKNGKVVKTKTVEQDTTFTGKTTKDEVTGETTITWEQKNHTYKPVNTPVEPGYTADKKIVGGETVTPDNPNRSYTVVYTPNGSIVPVDPNGNPIPNTPSVPYETDPTDPTKVVDGKVPEVPGWTPRNGKPGDTVKPSDPTKDTGVTYDHTKTTSDPKVEGKQTVTYVYKDKNGKVVKTAEPAKTISIKESAQAQDQLPQTGEDNSKAALGLGLASILGGIGILGAFKRKKKEN